MNNAFDGPKKLTVEFLAQNRDSLCTHGLNSWITEGGDILLYLVVHWKGNKDSVEVFHYSTTSLIVKHLRSFEHELLYGLNSVVVIGEDEFFTSSYNHFHGAFLRSMEILFRPPLMHITYFNGQTGECKYAATRLNNPNGLAISNNKRLLFNWTYYVLTLLHNVLVVYNTVNVHVLIFTISVYQETAQK